MDYEMKIRILQYDFHYNPVHEVIYKNIDKIYFKAGCPCPNAQYRTQTDNNEITIMFTSPIKAILLNKELHLEAAVEPED
jgi:hypothetical protein